MYERTFIWTDLWVDMYGRFRTYESFPLSSYVYYGRSFPSGSLDKWGKKGEGVTRGSREGGASWQTERTQKANKRQTKGSRRVTKLVSASLSFYVAGE